MTNRNPFAAMRTRGDLPPACARNAYLPWNRVDSSPPVVIPIDGGVQTHAGLFGAMEPNDMLPSRK